VADDDPQGLRNEAARHRRIAHFVSRELAQNLRELAQALDERAEQIEWRKNRSAVYG
jgi:hypothetical protein